MPQTNHYEHLPVAITICDADGIIVEMNEKSAEMYGAFGGKALIGAHLLDCHPEPSRTQVTEMLANQTANTYTTEKGSLKKMVHQVPLHVDGQFSGLAELVFEIPPEIPNHIRE